MAITEYGTYNQCKVELLSGGIDFANDDINVALMTASYTPDIDADQFWDDISADEAEDTHGDYPAGGATIGSPTVTMDTTNDLAVFDGANVALTGVTTAYQYIVFYKDSGTPGTSPLIGYQKHDTEQTLVNQNLTINFASTGIANIADAGFGF